MTTAIDDAIDEGMKLAKLKQAMARETFLTPEDLAERYQVGVETIYRWDIPRTVIPGTRLVRYHPVDVLEWEQRPQRVAS